MPQPQFDANRFKPLEKYETFTYEVQGDESGDPPFTASIRSSLSHGEIRGLFLEDENATDEDMWPLMGPYVRSWNLTAQLADTGDTVAVPPPAETDGASFALLPPRIVIAILNRLRTGPIRKLDDALVPKGLAALPGGKGRKG